MGHASPLSSPRKPWCDESQGDGAPGCSCAKTRLLQVSNARLKDLLIVLTGTSGDSWVVCPLRHWQGLRRVSVWDKSGSYGNCKISLRRIASFMERNIVAGAASRIDRLLQATLTYSSLGMSGYSKFVGPQRRTGGTRGLKGDFG